MSEPLIYETDILDIERERYSTPARCEECGDLLSLAVLEHGVCWSCIHYLYQGN